MADVDEGPPRVVTGIYIERVFEWRRHAGRATTIPRPIIGTNEAPHRAAYKAKSTIKPAIASPTPPATFMIKPDSPGFSSMRNDQQMITAAKLGRARA